uniref:N/A n=1 Tax=Ganoderma boninense TaxID=34458 RepID=A0A5K1JVW7_9APHY|nr:N/A [Ganoderma boninense]
MSSGNGAPENAGPGSSPEGGSHSHPPSRPRSQTQRSQSAVQSRTELLHRILEEALAGKITDDELVDRLRNLQATPEESTDILDELAQRRLQNQQGARPQGGGDRPEGTEGTQDNAPESVRNRISWELLKEKLDALRTDKFGDSDAFDLLASLRDDEDDGAIPKAVLDVAPYLADVGGPSESDEHITKTLEIRRVLSREKVADKVITHLQLANLPDPLPRSIWRDIVADKFVHFEKIFAAIDSAFDHDDEPKDFHGGYVLVKRDQFCARKPVETEGDWVRVFEAWATAVKLVYRHRAAELDAYKRIILNVFRARRSEPLIAIHIDRDVREDYAKSPFHLDDRTRSDIPLFTHLTSPYASSSRASKAPLASRLSNPSAKRSFLAVHPNQPFVESVLWGLEHGFWPLDEGDWDADEELMNNYSMDEPDLDALRAFRDREVNTRRWSSPIDPQLAPCMKTSPMFVVWQHDKARVVTDHAASGLNDGIPRPEAKVRYDAMQDFGQALHDAHRRYPGRHITLYKSDVSKAFLNLPAHPVWQLRQVVAVDGNYHIVRRLVFGSRASPRIWCSVSALLCWIASVRYRIRGLCVYMDDFYGWDFGDSDYLLFFHGCPYDDEKQLDGQQLKIIGFWVDVISLSITMPPHAVDDAIAAINTFIVTPNRKPHLREWQRLAGHLNWILNAIPLGRPALSSLYRKISGKTKPNASVFLNREVISDLSWFRDLLPSALGVRFVDQGRWDPEEADCEVWSDAALTGGMAFVYGHEAFVYKIEHPDPANEPDILFFEMFALTSALAHLADLPSPPRRILFRTDSLNSVDIHDRFRATESQHNAPLLATASITIPTGIDFRVIHVPGEQNPRADMLSRLLLEDYARQYPEDRISFFSPPRELLPLRWQNTF